MPKRSLSKRTPKMHLAYGEPPIKIAKYNWNVSLCDLPLEVLEKIIEEFNISDYKSIRATSKQLKSLNDDFVMHEFRRALHRQANLNSTSCESAVLEIIKHAIEVYVRSGFGSIVCLCILPTIRSSCKHNFSSHTCQLENFLRKFYDMVDDLCDMTPQQSRMLYTLTLIRFLRFFAKFDKFVIMSSTMMPLHWRVIIELKGPWLGLLWTKYTGPTLTYLRATRINLLVMLSEIIIHSITGTAFKCAWNCPTDIYALGNNTNGNHVPKTYFTIKVFGPNTICSIFRSCLEDPLDEFNWPSKWPTDQFTVLLDIVSPEAEIWGCSKWQRMEFGPFTQSEIFSYTNYSV